MGRNRFHHRPESDAGLQLGSSLETWNSAWNRGRLLAEY